MKAFLFKLEKTLGLFNSDQLSELRLTSPNAFSESLKELKLANDA